MILWPIFYSFGITRSTKISFDYICACGLDGGVIIGTTKLSFDYICACGLDFEVMKLLVLKCNFDDFFPAKTHFNLISATCSLDVKAILITFPTKVHFNLI